MSDETCDCKNGCGCRHDCDCGCTCCGDGHRFRRRYQTREEQIAEMEAYLAELRVEVQAVEERLADLHK